MTNKPECEDCETCASRVGDEREPENKRCARHLTDRELADELSSLDVPEFSWQASLLAAARDRLVGRVLVKKAAVDAVKTKLLAEAWAVIGKDGQITVEFCDSMFPLSVFEDVDDAEYSLRDDPCGRVVRVQIVEAPPEQHGPDRP